MKTKYTKILHSFVVFLSLFYIISGTLKLLDVRTFMEFSSVIGFPYLLPFFVFIIPLEIMIGVSLIFKSIRRQASFISMILLSIFSMIYLYGYYFNNVSNCHCFGNYHILSDSIYIFFLKNTVLLLLSWYVWKNGDKVKVNIVNWQYILFFMSNILSVLTIISLYDPILKESDQYIGMNISDIELKNVYNT